MPSSPPGATTRVRLNQDAHKNGSVQIAGPDFGTGSSREHAVGAQGPAASASSWPPNSLTFQETLASRAWLPASSPRRTAVPCGLLSRLFPAPRVTVSLEGQDLASGAISGTFQIDDTCWTLMEGWTILP